MMAGPHNFKQSRWWPYIHGLADNRNRHGYDDMCLYIINAMEMAYAMGKRDGKENAETHIAMRTFSK